jgi:hypothetical protein
VKKTNGEILQVKTSGGMQVLNAIVVIQCKIFLNFRYFYLTIKEITDLLKPERYE